MMSNVPAKDPLVKSTITVLALLWRTKRSAAKLLSKDEARRIAAAKRQKNVIKKTFRKINALFIVS